MKLSRRITLILILLLLGGCVRLDGFKVAFNTDPDDEDGIGGTGKTVAHRSVNTYVRGRITAFGSIYVNGLRITYGDKTPVTENGVTANTGALKVGQVVEVSARNWLAGTRGLQINIRHEVVGKVASVDRAEESFMIMGQKITVKGTGVKLPDPGAWLKVSGFRDSDDVVHATRLDPSETGNVVLRGELVESMGHWYVGGIQLHRVSHLKLTEGSRVVIHGSNYDQGTLDASKLIELQIPANNKYIGNFHVQGFLQRDAEGKLKIDNITINVSNVSLQGKVGKLVQLELKRNAEGKLEVSQTVHAAQGDSRSGRPGGRPDIPPGLEGRDELPPGQDNRPEDPPGRDNRPERPEQSRGRDK